MIDPASETSASVTASVAAKGMVAGGVGGLLGWITSDAIIGLIGAGIALLGLLVSSLFRYLENRDKHRETLRVLAKTDAEEARAQERHAAEMALLAAQRTALLGSDTDGDAGRSAP